jgi:hypothetical protein|tara:strand:- start:220 stop:2394 length:2175 start_codon:yes stop_codon:yes gene_type:complete
MKYKFKISFLAILSLLFTVGFSQTIQINEIQVSNKKTYCDGFGEFDDWIEIYNPSDSAVSLSGLFITNNIKKPTKHQITNKKSKWMTVPPKGYVLLWIDSDTEQGNRHISFKLNKQNGFVALYDADTNLLDSVSYSYQKRDYSLGRFSESNKSLTVFKKATPSSANKDGLLLTPNDVRVIANKQSGFYENKIQIELSVDFLGDIYYTLDGSVPNSSSYKYEGPIQIDSTLVLRSLLIRDGYFPNYISANTYFINEKSTIPVLSLITDPKYLWSSKRGIYTNYEARKWERPAHVEYFDLTKSNSKEIAFSKTVNIRIAGKTSRRQPKKSFVMSSNDFDGQKRINYKIFNDKPITSFKSIWVRADATSGRNVPVMWVGERFKNELLYEVNKEMSNSLDMQAYEPVSLYLNGEYWGLYNLMERKGADFIKDNHGEKDVHILTGESAKVVEGKKLDYVRLLALIYDSDITNDAIYETVCQRMDVNSYIDYWVNESYCGAHDINVNIRFWKPKRTASKWRWISYDQDSWNDHDEESLDYFLKHGKVMLLERLMKNKTFQEKWINRMCDYLNTGFKPENVIEKVDQITARIRVEDLKDRARWQDTLLYVPKNQRIDSIKAFALKRPDFLRSHMLSFFEIDGDVELIKIITDSEQGKVRVNQLLIDSVWQGQYLGGVALEIEAVANEGFKFVKWKERKLGKDSLISIDPSKFHNFTPIFEKKKLVSTDQSK